MRESQFRKIGVVGAGTMGSGIALTALLAGFDVVLQDPFPSSLEKAQAYLEKFLQKKSMDDRMAAVRLASALSDLSDCDVVIEAALEDLTIKHDIFAVLDEVCGRETVFATNTSTLSVTQIAAKTMHPERFAGMHFFNPAPVLPLVEIVQGANTASAVIEQLASLARDLGKTPVITEDSPGFIVNRVARPFYGEALRLAGEKISTVPEIDLALRLGAGFRMGPFQLMDLIGVDINATAMRSMFEQTFGEARYRPHPLQIRQMNSGNLGRKTGRGFYDYRGDTSGIRADEAPPAIGGRGLILFYEGRWDKGVYDLLADSGFQPEAYPEVTEEIRAVFIAQSQGQELTYELEKLDWLLPKNVPIFVQCNDAGLEAHLPQSVVNGRFIGVDMLFLAEGRIATLVAGPQLSQDARLEAEKIVRSLGRLPLWVKDAPGLLLPRVVCMLINEAAFAVQDGIADEATIDLAMQLGVNYPKGLLAWGASLGWHNVLSVLEHLHFEYGEERYRPCRLIRSWARNETRTWTDAGEAE